MTFAGMELNEAEQKLVDAAQKGEICNLQSDVGEENDPANGDSWGDERTVRAEVIRRLCVGADPHVRVDYRGIHLIGAKIAGQVDLREAEVGFPFGMEHCWLEEPFLLANARTRTMSLDGSHLPAVLGQSATIDGGFRCAGGLFAGYDVAGRGKIAVVLDAAEIREILGLGSDFRAQAQVSIMQARIVGQLTLTGGAFQGGGKMASRLQPMGSR